jgi:hypothetical protein
MTFTLEQQKGICLHYLDYDLIQEEKISDAIKDKIFLNNFNITVERYRSGIILKCPYKNNEIQLLKFILSEMESDYRSNIFFTSELNLYFPEIKSKKKKLRNISFLLNRHKIPISFSISGNKITVDYSDLEYKKICNDFLGR